MQLVQQEIETLFPGEVERIRLVKDTTVLDGLVREYTSLKRSLEDLLDHYMGRRKRLLKVKRRMVSVSFPQKSKPCTFITCQAILLLRCHHA